MVEVLASIVIVLILAALLIPSFQGIRDRAGEAACIANMRSIAVGLRGYMQDNENVWPQGPSVNEERPWEEFWLKVLQPYQIGPDTWQCPTLTSALASVPKENRPRLHYVPTMFGPKANDANRFSTHPWLMERSSVHGQGPLICFPDGSVKSFNKVLGEAGVR